MNISKILMQLTVGTLILTVVIVMACVSNDSKSKSIISNTSVTTKTSVSVKELPLSLIEEISYIPYTNTYWIKVKGYDEEIYTSVEVGSKLLHKTNDRDKLIFGITENSDYESEIVVLVE